MDSNDYRSLELRKLITDMTETPPEINDTEESIGEITIIRPKERRVRDHLYEYRHWNALRKMKDQYMDPSWENSFEQYLKDIGPRPSKRHNLVRHPDKWGIWGPGNVQWVL